jgi:hypothetical protein
VLVGVLVGVEVLVGLGVGLFVGELVGVNVGVLVGGGGNVGRVGPEKPLRAASEPPSRIPPTAAAPPSPRSPLRIERREAPAASERVSRSKREPSMFTSVSSAGDERTVACLNSPISFRSSGETLTYDRSVGVISQSRLRREHPASSRV